MNVRLVVVRPESKRQTFAVRLPIVIGRSEEAKFRIQQDRVSRRHCELFSEDGGVYLRDLGSTNGTFLDGELIDPSVRHPLEPGVTVRVGSLEFRVEFESAGVGAVVPVGVDESDRTVSLAHADNSERLHVEHAGVEHAGHELVSAEKPQPEIDAAPALPTASPPAIEPVAAAEQPIGTLDFLTAERPAAHDESAANSDDKLGDFLKGLE